MQGNARHQKTGEGGKDRKDNDRSIIKPVTKVGNWSVILLGTLRDGVE